MKIQKNTIMNALEKIISAPELLTMDGLRPADEHGWALIRPSNTEAVLTIRTEAKTEAEFGVWKNRLRDWLIKAGLDQNTLVGLEMNRYSIALWALMPTGLALLFIGFQSGVTSDSFRGPIGPHALWRALPFFMD